MRWRTNPEKTSKNIIAQDIPTGEESHTEKNDIGLGDCTDPKMYRTGRGVVNGLICYENHVAPVKSLLALIGEAYFDCVEHY